MLISLTYDSLVDSLSLSCLAIGSSFSDCSLVSTSKFLSFRKVHPEMTIEPKISVDLKKQSTLTLNNLTVSNVYL